MQQGNLRQHLPVAGVSQPEFQNKAQLTPGPNDDITWPNEVLAELRSACEGQANVWAGCALLAPQLPLPGMKASLFLEKLHKLARVIHTVPPQEGLEDIESLAGFYFAIETTVPAAKIETSIQIAGVTRVSLRELPLNAVVEKLPPVAEAPKPRAVAPTTGGERKPTADDAARPNETLRVDIERLDQLMNLAGQLVINKARFAQIGEGLRDMLPTKQMAQWLNNAAAQATLALKVLDQPLQPGQELDVDAARISLRRMATEMTAIQTEFARVTGMRGKVNELYEAVHQLDRVAEGIQRSVMDTRMVPIGPLFQRFKRVVRDVTRTNGKDIRLVIRGEKTELDKRMIDELGDPLIHMVRNSADHGVESPEQRAAAGKSAQGSITLDAFHRGNSIVILVQDDGRGLDQSKIVKKAIERGIVTAADAERLTSHQIHQLIWEPGFSTAEKVTEISGRGMGMDIVRSKIESLNGTVELDSIPGQGATFTIKLPLTLAILPSLMTVIDGDTFALPLESVVEIVSVKQEHISTIHGQRAARIRGRVISVVRLDELFTWNQPPLEQRAATPLEGTLLVIGHEGAELGLLVDQVIGEDDIVIKALAENYRNVEGIAGASILGDGRVALILDIAALLLLAVRKPFAASATTAATEEVETTTAS
jgi:two-component system chemotaxis sensor kinase CheA